MTSATTQKEIQEIIDVLSSPNYCGTYDGGSEGARGDIAEDWHDCGFSAEEVDRWCEAGCWDASTAVELQMEGFDPRADTLRYRKGEEQEGMAPMYALCNGDTSVAKVRW